jgi:hypothetical protein
MLASYDRIWASSRVIPNQGHFVWFGPTFPLTHALAVRSLWLTNRPTAIHLYLSDDLTGQPHFDALQAEIPALRIHGTSFDELTEGVDVERNELRVAWDSLMAERRFAALSDVIRYLVLHRSGGVYMDFDTITVRDLAPLRAGSGFCGREAILVPGAVERRSKLLRRFRTGPLHAVRLACSRLRGGVRWFKRIECLFALSINGAVLGLQAGHRVTRQALSRVPALYRQVGQRRPIIGPDLLQDLIEGCDDVAVLPPAAFYPLGPYMTRHYFSGCADVARLEREVVTDQTYVIHWYNDSSHGPGEIDCESIRRDAGRQLFARQALRYLPPGATKIRSP